MATASEIAFDNTAAGLLSTTVRGALDDIAAVGATQQERLDAIEARRSTFKRALRLGPRW